MDMSWFGILFVTGLCIVPVTPTTRPRSIYVNDLCTNVHCVEGQMCRVVKPCQAWGGRCEPSIQCVDCIPEGVDRVCNARGYDYGIAAGNVNKAELLEPLECSPEEPCPLGSDCVITGYTSSKSRGVCCFGGPRGHHVTTCDRKCRSCVPACPDGYTCKQDVTASCNMESSYCDPSVKKGRCMNYADKCFALQDGVECTHDQQCKGRYKCCEQCDGRKICMNVLKL